MISETIDIKNNVKDLSRYEEMYTNALCIDAPNTFASLKYVEFMIRNNEVLDESCSEICISRCNRAIVMNEYCHVAWRLMSDIYNLKKDYENATNAMLRALDYEKTAPILSYSILPISLELTI